MYLIDTNVISEARRGLRANPGVRAFFGTLAAAGTRVYLSAITIGELRRGIELLRHRNSDAQADLLETWLTCVLAEHKDAIIDVDGDTAQLWGRLRVPLANHEIDKLIAASALLHGLTLVTRNTADFRGTNVKLLNPFS
jgi:toxin FitB